MPCQLPADCLNEIFEYLEEDKIALHSCLLVNRLWCEISVRILWRDIWKFKYSVNDSHQSGVDKSIVSTLIACLPNESMALLYRNEIFIPTPTSKQPLYNYAAFCKVLSIYEINKMIDSVFKNEQSITSLNLRGIKNTLVAEGIIKMFMNQIPSLKKLIHLPYFSYNSYTNISFTCFPGASDCLADLSALCCNSDAHSEFFYQLSQICHNLQSLSIGIEDEISNGLEELISLQNNLENLNLFACQVGNWESIIPALEKHSNSLTTLHLYGDNNSLSLLFIASFSNLQEIKISFIDGDGTNFEDFKKLQNVTFSKLKILKIPYRCPKLEHIMKFLENNGKYLEELYIGINDNSLNLSIAKYCLNLEKFYLRFNDSELDTFKTILDSCKYLESIKVWCGMGYLSEKEILETVVKYSPESFCELKIIYKTSEPSSEDLKSFFINWKNRASKKLLSLIIINYFNLKEENIKIIEKYKNLGVIKKFEIKRFGYEEEEEESKDRLLLNNLI